MDNESFKLNDGSDTVDNDDDSDSDSIISSDTDGNDSDSDSIIGTVTTDGFMNETVKW